MVLRASRGNYLVTRHVRIDCDSHTKKLVLVEKFHFSGKVEREGKNGSKSVEGKQGVRVSQGCEGGGVVFYVWLLYVCHFSHSQSWSLSESCP